MHHVQANGASIPALGLGTWQLRGAECRRIVSEGLRLGYRHLDTAQMYGNEREVGEGIREAGIARADVFLTTKIWPDCLEPEAFRRAADERLALLGLDYVDLLLIHWPNPAVPLKDTLGALTKAKRDGLARHIGISNFNVALIEEAVSLSDEPLVANQVEYHPFIDQSRLLAACRKHGMALTAYAPVARGRALNNKTISAIADRKGRKPAQIALRWLVQQEGIVAIPKTATPARLAENLAVFDFSLDEDETNSISALADPTGRVVHAAWAPVWD